MYCPRCSQQANEESNFCARCGFQFAGLREAVTAGGLVPPNYRVDKVQSVLDPANRSPRQKGIRFGAKLSFFSLVLLPIFFLLSFPADSPAPLLVPFTILLTGVSWMLYSRLFRESVGIPASSFPQLPIGNIPVSATLPSSPQQAIPVARNWQLDTGEMQPSSVTERTTNLLDPQ